jgi:hypothetical protein
MTEQQIEYTVAPLTPGQWLLRSLYWVGGCHAGLWLLAKAMPGLKDYATIIPPSVLVLLLWGCCYASIFLIWRKVISGSSAVLLHNPHKGAFSLTALLMIVWRVVLVFGLVYSLAITLLMSGAMLWDMFDHEPIGDYF